MIGSGFFLLPLFFPGFGQQGDAQDSAWNRDNYIKLERTIPMRDGVELFTTVYAPEDLSEKHPMLVDDFHAANSSDTYPMGQRLPESNYPYSS